MMVHKYSLDTRFLTSALTDSMKIKSLKSINIPVLDDNDSFRAGLYHIRFNNLSFVDCFVLAIANKLKLKVYTTDGPLKMAAKKINVPYDYLPI